MKFSQLTAGGALAGTEVIPMVQSSLNYYTTPLAVKTYILGQTLNAFSGAATFALTLGVTGKLTPSGGIVGTATNDSASVGNVGQYTETLVIVATNFGGTGVYGDLASASLTAGDWDVTGLMSVTLNGATCTLVGMGISTTSGNFSTGLTAGVNFLQALPPTSTADVAIVVPVYRMSLASTTTVYLKYRASYSAGNPQVNGARLSARRVR